MGEYICVLIVYTRSRCIFVIIQLILVMLCHVCSVCISDDNGNEFFHFNFYKKSPIFIVDSPRRYGLYTSFVNLMVCTYYSRIIFQDSVKGVYAGD